MKFYRLGTIGGIDIFVEVTQKNVTDKLIDKIASAISRDSKIIFGKEVKKSKALEFMQQFRLMGGLKDTVEVFRTETDMKQSAYTYRGSQCGGGGKMGSAYFIRKDALV